MELEPEKPLGCRGKESSKSPLSGSMLNFPGVRVVLGGHVDHY